MKVKILEVRLAHEVHELPRRFGWARSERASFYEVEGALRRARDDDRIGALMLEVSDLTMGWSKAESIHRAIRAVRERGKKTVAFLEGVGNAAFMMACACETLVLSPSTTLSLQSLSSDSFFFKDLLGELGLSPELDAVGEFKSAGEMFERRSSSEPHRREIGSILRDLNDQFVALIAEGRELSVEAAGDAVARGPFLAEDAKAARLIDHVEHEDFCETLLEEALGGPAKRVSHVRYAASPGWIRRVLRWRRPQVAVIHAVGVLTSGEGRRPASGTPTVGARSLRDMLRRVREHPRVRAVVLRVESPGGGAVASDVIHRELSLTAKDKPVVVSMGDVAASGGYYISAAAGAVLAEGTSLTGSIGVIGGKIVIKQLLNRLGIHRESLTLGANAGIFSPLRSFTDEERAWHKRSLQHFYRRRFLPVVAEGRNLTMEQADAAGRGRVWTGRQARDRGLVDELGGLGDAIRLAHEKAELSLAKTRVVVYAQRRGLRELMPFGLGASASLVTDVLAKLAWVEELAREDVLLLMPGLFRIR